MKIRDRARWLLTRRSRKAEGKTIATPLSDSLVIDAYFERPTKCVFCDSSAGFSLSAKGAQSLTCGEHIGSFITDWTTEREIVVVRL